MPHRRLACCASRAAGQQALLEHRPQALITDLQLPDGHGLDLIKLARRLDRAPEILVISVMGDERTVVDAISHNFRPVVISDCVGDRAAGPHDASLFDLEQKYADLIEASDVADHFGFGSEG